jgi:hypothetical protein
MSRLLVVLCLAVTLAPAARGAAEWMPLFNGKDLDGWEVSQAAKAKFLVEDGCLVGTQDDGKGADLATKQQWDNFELRVTYRVVWPANSGFWFRYDKGRGYQFDVLKYKNPVAYSGTLYCPGKMFITTNLDESLENRDDWNEAQIYANGDQIILWLNGHKVGECRDTTLTKGAIGIQVHGGNDMKGMKITVKRIDLRPLEAGEAPTAPAKKAP